ncbi:hypothetical protein DWF00_00545 [Bosea caraganae]|uniref:Uncharacterized protein n=1 Tax=Bosea caraganae TaxID=2763117 RepID=A0A370L9Q0_9HYPH|nr:hypothetical protein [Bosea caraganae]RDJ26702.1 hypothetical protein DWE98_07560 [Bosea caraganae]RDJ30589.1 hypothetical protein DWF00_00545 [Bosea caraganae]
MGLPLFWRPPPRKQPRFHYRDFPRIIFSDCESALRGDSRPIDRYLDNYLSYSNFEALEERQRGFHGANRVVVNATVTTKDNLSVRLWMKRLDDRGRWTPAPEWRDIPYYGQSAVMERPDDEVLFIRDVDRLLVEKVAHYERYDRVDKDERRLVEASCQLVNAVFWLTVPPQAEPLEVRSPFDAPSYAGLRTAPWRDDLTQEFAVESTLEFVSFVNELRRAEKRLPIPQGSFPAKASDLEKLVKEARSARARQQRRPPPASDSASE